MCFSILRLLVIVPQCLRRILSTQHTTQGSHINCCGVLRFSGKTCRPAMHGCRNCKHNVKMQVCGFCSIDLQISVVVCFCSVRGRLPPPQRLSVASRAVCRLWFETIVPMHCNETTTSIVPVPRPARRRKTTWPTNCSIMTSTSIEFGIVSWTTCSGID